MAGDQMHAEVSDGARPISIHAGDGVVLGGTRFEPFAEARSQVLVLGATAVPQRYYAPFAAYLARAGHRVVTFDYRGIGDSRPDSLVGFRARMADWARKDAVAALETTRAFDNTLPTFLVGHSFGGQSLGLAPELREVDGAFLVASQLGYLGHWPSALERARLFMILYGALPVASNAFGYLPGWLGLKHDLPKGVALEWAKWCRHPDYLGGYEDDADQNFASFRAPISLVSVTDDDMAPARSVRALVRRLRNAPLVHDRVAPADVGADHIGHFGFFRPKFRDSLWRLGPAFFDDVLGGRTPRRAFRRPLGRPTLSDLIDLREEDLMSDLGYGRPS
ncbi:MAG: alpha/beta fold hydrolase [Myxococcota bacterium]